MNKKVDRRTVLSGLFAAGFSAYAKKAIGILPTASDQQIVYIGSYTRTSSKGIYAWAFDSRKGSLSSLGLVASCDDPTWLTIHPRLEVIYASNELVSYEGKATGSIISYKIERSTGRLLEIERVDSHGMNPSHTVVDPNGRWLIVANYGSALDVPGSVSVFGIGSTGATSKKPDVVISHSGSDTNPSRQKAAHPHSTILSPDDQFLFVPDLGANRIVQYRWDRNEGALTSNVPPFVTAHQSGAGPRHAAFTKNGRYLFINNELDSTITTYAYDQRLGALSPLQTVSTVPNDFSGQNSTAELELHPNGRFLYASNRGHESIACFSVDDKNGRLTIVDTTATKGHFPRGFGIDLTGSYLFAANHRSDSVVVLRIDQSTGKLSETGLTIQTPAPTCAVFIPRR